MKFAYIILISSFVMGGCYSSGQIPSSNYNSNYRYRGDYGSSVTYQTFYDELQPYGNWINYPGYGYVWQPRQSSGFRPYESDGHWVSTVDGWAWASDQSWGWAPFHYGRWLNEPSIGWAWVPGYEWAPAWVTWGRYNDYYAWAPLAPGINFSFGHTWRAPDNYWSYVPNNCIQQRNLNRYIVRDNRNPVVVNNITIINNYNSYNKSNYYRGPDYNEVEKYTHTTIHPVTIASAQRPGVTKIDNANRYEVFRPAVATNTTEATTARPARFKDLKDAGSAFDTRKTQAQQSQAPNQARLNDNLRSELADENNDQNIPAQNSFNSAPTKNSNPLSDGNSNGSNVNNNLPVNSAPTNAATAATPGQAPSQYPANNRRRQARIQQAQANDVQPETNQPVFQNNRRAQISPDILQQNNQVSPQQQRQFPDSRQPAQQQSVQPLQQRTIAPRQQINVNREKPASRPTRRQ